MLKLLADENFDGDVVSGLLHRKPHIDILRVQDIDGLAGARDPVVLEWAAREGRVLLTHDVRTMSAHAWRRVVAGLPMPGVFLVVNGGASVAKLIDELLVLEECSLDGEWEGQVTYVPL